MPSIEEIEAQPRMVDEFRHELHVLGARYGLNVLDVPIHLEYLKTLLLGRLVDYLEAATGKPEPKAPAKK